MSHAHQDLIELLLHREQVIADHSWRDRDPDRHLQALRQVSEKIDEWAGNYRDMADAKLKHFLDSMSYAKALVHLLAMTNQPS